MAGLLGVHCAVRPQQLGDAEVEQLDLTGGGDHDVAGLEVAMDHQVAVGVGHRLAHRHEQLEPLLQACLVGAAPLGDGAALHQLHHHVGAAVAGHAAVEQAGDAGMLQPRQDLALGGEAPGLACGVAADQLERHLLLELPVGALGAVDLAHAAAADQAGDAPGADALA